MSDVIEGAAFLNKVTPAHCCREAATLDALFRNVTGWMPRLWPGGMLGYGTCTYIYASGRSGSFLAPGFAPRKVKLSIYIMPGYADFSEFLSGLHKQKRGKSCLYINKLEDVSTGVLAQLIRAGLDDLRAYWPVTPARCVCWTNQCPCDTTRDNRRHA